MREIKFRAWDKDNGLMSKPFGLIHGQELYLDKDIVMQYTGLKDKNGKEIYEGDIMGGPSKEWNMTIEFENGSFTCSTPRNRLLTNEKINEWEEKGNEFMVLGCKNSLEYLGANTHLEIIGNIYENPDLLD